MLLAVLIAGALLWASYGTAGLRDKRQWPAIGATLVGVVLMAKGHPFIGLGLIGGAAIWSRLPRRRGAPSPVPRFEDHLALAEARDLLGIPPDADRAAILAAHRRLIARNHPDSGGTEALAARLNAARDLLLKYQRP